jgi:hypothetical protein
VFGRILGDCLPYRGTLPLAKPDLYRLAGDDGGWPGKGVCLLAQGRVDLFRKREVKVLHVPITVAMFMPRIYGMSRWHVKDAEAGQFFRGAVTG